MPKIIYFIEIENEIEEQDLKQHIELLQQKDYVSDLLVHGTMITNHPTRWRVEVDGKEI